MLTASGTMNLKQKLLYFALLVGFIVFLALLLRAQQSTPNDVGAELLRRMSTIEAQHLTIEANQKTAQDQIDAVVRLQNQITTDTADIANLRQELKDHEAQQISHPADIAVLKDEMANIAKVVEWTLGILGSTIVGLIAWAVKQMRKTEHIAVALDKKAQLDSERHELIVNDLGRLAGKA